jgi:hypothetical protein
MVTGIGSPGVSTGAFATAWRICSAGASDKEDVLAELTHQRAEQLREAAKPDVRPRFMVNRTCKPVDRWSGFPREWRCGTVSSQRGRAEIASCLHDRIERRALVRQIPPDMQIYDLFLVFLAHFLAAANSEGLAAGVQAQIRS